MKNIFQERRKKFISKMDQKSVAVFASASQCHENGHTCYDYRQDSDFYYLTGFEEPDSVCLLSKDVSCPFIMFVKPNDPQKEIWEGKCTGVENAVECFDASASYSIDKLDSILPSYLENIDTLYYVFGKNRAFNQKIINILNSIKNKIRLGISAPHLIVDPTHILHEMRLIKTKDEIKILKKAVDITCDAYIEAMKTVKPGMYEYEIEAVIEYIFKTMGAQGSAFHPIIASGPNSTILHYDKNNRKTEKIDILTIDAGAKYNYYAADVTRSFPVNGRFSKEQEEIYGIVLDAQLEAIKKIRPGNTLLDVHNKAIEVLVEGLVKLKFFQKSAEDVISLKEYQKYYMHGTGHWLGIDVHDVGNYKVNNEHIKFKEGMVLTVEPGLYISSKVEGAIAKYKNIGIRIEDDVLVTKHGNEVLTRAIPKTIKAIESLMASGRKFGKIRYKVAKAHRHKV